MARSRTHTTMQSRSLIDLSFPWAWFPLDEGGGDGTGTATAVSNDSRATTLPDFDLATAIAEQWTLRPGFWTPNGSSQYISQVSGTALQSVFELGLGAMLIGIQVAVPRVAARRTILHIGSGTTGTADNGILLIAENNSINQKILMQVKDNANTNGTQYTGATAVQDGSAPFANTGITRSGSTATVATAGTAAVGDYVYISGSAVSTYNGIHKVTAIDAGVSYSFAVVGTPADDAGASTSAIVGSTWNIFAAIDNTSAKSATIYSQKATLRASALETGSLALTSHGTITLAGPSGNINPGVWLGRNARSSNQTFSPMHARRLLCINFGTAGLPSNIATKVLPALHRNSMIPNFEAFNAIAAGF